jgi:hypothetical protein
MKLGLVQLKLVKGRDRGRASDPVKLVEVIGRKQWPTLNFVLGSQLGILMTSLPLSVNLSVQERPHGTRLISRRKPAP